MFIFVSMETIEKIKGIHPGLILERDLKKRKIAKGRFAISINEFPQTLVSITKAKRKMNIPLSLKIEKKLGYSEGFLMQLQLYYDIAQVKEGIKVKTPNLELLRPSLFWDTSIDKIDWIKQKKAIIIRILERGNEIEKKEIKRFYKLKNLE